MADQDKNINLPEEEEELGVITLTDEETGEDIDFEVYASANIDGNTYYALVPVDEQGDEYIILKATPDGEDVLFETVDDDDEFEKVEEYFNDLLFNEVNYDEN